VVSVSEGWRLFSSHGSGVSERGLAFVLIAWQWCQ
jgi:hypothetical protein